MFAEGAVGIARPADARADNRDLGALGHPVQAQAVESGPVEGQGREHGADLIAKNGSPRPSGRGVAGHHHAVEDRVVTVVALEDPAIAALLRGAVFLPPSHVKAADQPVAQGAIVGAARRGVGRNGIVVVGKGRVGIAGKSRARVQQEGMMSGVDLGYGGVFFLVGALSQVLGGSGSCVE